MIRQTWQVPELNKFFEQTFERSKLKMNEKNHDYGGSWELMRPESITDQILTKVVRIRQLEELRKNGEDSLVAEGIDSELIDIINYAVFRRIKEIYEVS